MIIYKENKIPNIEDAVSLYRSVGWGHVKCPKALMEAISNSDLIITAWYNDVLIGLGRTISDTTLTVYFPDLLIHPDWQRMKVGTEIMKRLLLKYEHFHNLVLVAEDNIAKEFYNKFGFEESNSALVITKPFPSE